MNSVFTDENDIQGMREAGRLASEVLDHVAPFVQPGISTGELDRICHTSATQLSATRISTLSGFHLHLGQ